MSFTAFSKEFTANMFTSVENQFITKYLPQADGDAVRVYLYGLYLCNCKDEVDAEAVAKLLKIPYPRFIEIFGFWEECDLLHVLSRDPLMVEYLPVNSAIGKPKPLRPEKYAAFNRELLRLLSKAGKDFKPYEMQRILEFLENSPMEPQAFLLVAEYCIKKDGSKVTSAHMLNKANQLLKDHKFTFEQAEEEFSDYNKHEQTLSAVFNRMGIFRKPQDADYSLLEKWLAMGMEEGTIIEAAAALGKGSPATLDALVLELAEKNALTPSAAKTYLKRREALASTVFSLGRKLGVKIQNPRVFIETYAEKWVTWGFSDESLLRLAGIAFKLGYGFEETDTMVSSLHDKGMGEEDVKEYCAARERQLRLLQRIQSTCGVVKKSLSALDTIAQWKEMGFSDAMISEAAKRSAGAAAPLSYMNKLLTAWKDAGVFSPGEIPEKTSFPKAEFKNEAAVAADKRTERERFYAVRKERAERRANKVKQLAEQSEEYRRADSAIREEEIALARAEVFGGETETIKMLLEEHRAKRVQALAELGLKEEDLLPKYACPKCSDTGFLPNGRLCDCYKP